MKSWRALYESLVILMVVTYAILLVSAPTGHPLLTQTNLDRIDWAVIAFFAVEYMIRVVRSADKWRFVQRNWFDLVALIPINSTFRLARLIRVIRLIRIIKASPLLWNIVRSKQIQMMLVFATVVMVWSSAGIYFLENGVNGNIKNYGDALWWSIVTTTTVGYGDISPVSFGGRIIAAFLMMTGIGMIGTVTAALANHWVEYFQQKEPQTETASNRVHDELKRQAAGWLERVEELTDEEYRSLLLSMEVLRGQGGGPRE
ncbi:potassium channel family protein [Gorillibacterium sp. sgz5001074]|uniref:potassium channel family protein n=1 Tax=Gorillibacterium sp. sgz5001074 TaxID=3446695 RepID=UPI003F674FAD